MIQNDCDCVSQTHDDVQAVRGIAQVKEHLAKAKSTCEFLTLERDDNADDPTPLCLNNL
jgi:hypothetical protein